MTFVVLFVGIQLGFIGLDLLDRWLTRDERYGGERLRAGTVAFLLVVIAVYFGIQVGLMSLAPRVDGMMAAVQGWFGAVGDPADQGDAMPWQAALAVGAVCFYAGGLLDYLVHRFFNHSRPFWWTHEYHHLPNQVFVALPGLSVRPFSVFTAIPTAFGTMVVAYGVIVAAGWPLWDLRPLRWVVLVNTFLLTSSHSSFLRRWMWPHHVLRRLALTTPQEHLVHHSVEAPGNFGNMTTLWDRVFGTYCDPTLPQHREGAFELGLAYDQDFLGAITWGRIKLPPAFRERFQLSRYCNVAGPDLRSAGIQETP